MKNLVQRTLSGIIYVALIVGAVLAGGWWFSALMLLLAILAILEFQHITIGRPQNGWQIAATSLDLLMAITLICIPSLYGIPSVLLMAGCLVLLFYFLARFTIALYDKAANAFSSVAWSVMSLAYIALPLTMLNTVYDNNVKLSILAMFVMIWLNDTGAYCVGCTMGKHKMSPRLSPKKSWEGFFGGLFFCLVGGVLAYNLIPGSFSLVLWLVFGAMVCLLSTWGDLFESLLKRSHNIKDSGHLIPGHGGILDRIDSLLFVSIGTFAFFFLAQ